MDSPGSPLSELSSEDFQEEEHTHASLHALSDNDHDHDTESTRPSKRQRTANNKHESSHQNDTPTFAPSPHEEAYISSDTEGSVPGSPHIAGGTTTTAADDDDYGGYGHREQVSACKWDDCTAGDLGNMDLLVQHLHDEHIHARQKKYSCEWGDCSRKGIPHASGYALRAHMRSHTREKPFYCSLPECDRSFTRSDALAKHMRTVHETEALRPSDPVPKHHSSNPQNKQQRVRLTFKGLGSGPSNGTATTNTDIAPKPDTTPKPKSNASAPSSPKTAPLTGTGVPADDDYENTNVTFLPPLDSYTDAQPIRTFPPDIHFEEWELRLSPRDLVKSLRMQLQHANEDSALLMREIAVLEGRRKGEWVGKELCLENVMEGELAVAEGRGVIQDGRGLVEGMREDVGDSKELDLGGDVWWRDGEVMRKIREGRGDDSASTVKVEGGVEGGGEPIILG